MKRYKQANGVVPLLLWLLLLACVFLSGCSNEDNPLDHEPSSSVTLTPETPPTGSDTGDLSPSAVPSGIGGAVPTETVISNPPSDWDWPREMWTGTRSEERQILYGVTQTGSRPLRNEVDQEILKGAIVKIENGTTLYLDADKDPVTISYQIVNYEDPKDKVTKGYYAVTFGDLQCSFIGFMELTGNLYAARLSGTKGSEDVALLIEVGSAGRYDGYYVLTYEVAEGRAYVTQCGLLSSAEIADQGVVAMEIAEHGILCGNESYMLNACLAKTSDGAWDFTKYVLCRLPMEVTKQRGDWVTLRDTLYVYETCGDELPYAVAPAGSEVIIVGTDEGEDWWYLESVEGACGWLKRETYGGIHYFQKLTAVNESNAFSKPKATPSPKATPTPEATPTVTPTPMPTSVPRDELTILDTNPIPEITEQVFFGELHIEGNTFTLREYMRKDNDPVGEIIYLDSHTYLIESTENITFGITNGDTYDEHLVYLNYDIISYEDFLAYYPGLTAWGIDCRIWVEGDTIVCVIAGSISAAG